MIIGIGTDIVNIQRIAQLHQKHGERFVRRLLSKAERQNGLTQLYPERFLAKRWALKEAVAKALGTGISQGVSFQDMTIAHYSSGQPYLTLAGPSLDCANALGITHWHISVSDEAEQCVAYVLAEALA